MGLQLASLFDFIVVLGIAAAVPLALGGRVWRWEVTAAAAAVPFCLSRGGLAAALVVPFFAVAAGGLVGRLRWLGRRRAATVRSQSQSQGGSGSGSGVGRASLATLAGFVGDEAEVRNLV